MFKHPLARDVAWLLTLKLIALAALYAAFFAPSHRPRIDPAARIDGDPISVSSSTQPSGR